MTDELARAFAFMARADMGGTRVDTSSYGTVVATPELPLRQDSNYLLVDRTEASAEELAEELARHRLRVVFVRDDESSRRLAAEFETLGWQSHHGVVMAHRRPPERPGDPGLVTEVDAALLDPPRREVVLGAPWGSPELADQLAAAKRMIASRVDARFLAVVVESRVAAYTDLYLADGVAQIEDLATVEEHRNRGYATALVLRALADARSAGADLVFLVALADDWPRDLYGRLGFDVIGDFRKFFPVTAGGHRGV